jgi:3-hydroxyisobutyrate dehydrogenase-like beta-hydroxyacid dehydrogenase
MGTALANALISAGHDVTVWNRGPGRARPFADRAIVAESAAAACRTSDTVAVCLYDYASYMEVLGSEEASRELGGKTLIQFTTDTAEEAQRLAAWAAEQGIEVLEAAILAYPGQIGTDAAVIAYAGPHELYMRLESIRIAFGGRSVHAGEPVGAASVIDVAVLGVFYASAMSYLQGVALCERESVDIGTYASVLASWLPTVRKLAESSVPVLVSRAFASEDQASLELHRFGALHVHETVVNAGLHSGFSTAIVEAFDRAIAHGHAGHELPALVDGLAG